MQTTGSSKELRVGVLMGGVSSERPVSLRTGFRVAEALNARRFAVSMLDTATLRYPAGTGLHLVVEDIEDLPQGLQPFTFDHVAIGSQARIDVAFIALHGRYGEDGTIQGLLDLCGVPYTGSGVLASALAMDKTVSKTVFQVQGIPTPPWVTLRRTQAEWDELLTGAAASHAAWLERHGLAMPVVVKPSREGSTIGVTICKHIDQLTGALVTASQFDRDVLIEQFVPGVEITAAVLGNREPVVLPLIEIVPASGIYDYQAKYTPGATDEIVPARIPEEMAQRASALALAAHRAIGCRGISRVDAMINGDEVQVLEVNTMPGMTATSLVPRAAAAAGIDFPALVERLVDLALEEE